MIHSQQSYALKTFEKGGHPNPHFVQEGFKETWHVSQPFLFLLTGVQKGASLILDQLVSQVSKIKWLFQETVVVQPSISKDGLLFRFIVSGLSCC